MLQFASREVPGRPGVLQTKPNNLQLLSQYHHQPPSTQFPREMAFTASDILKIIAAIILPPLGVFLERGCGADLLINILLTILGWIPGVIHALYIILKY
ncbi:hypothetical protein DFH07DRAFT_1064157 [Mycena maculata]|uniref:Plasma membrane proteolipid 3 n=1 Tax=Mycena maculata TaxID=230809 RepID=A0AAD7N0W0_9AGAR|nr:hypothetical protein DFH07DRAFT_1064157 [Mycena maculata]